MCTTIASYFYLNFVILCFFESGSYDVAQASLKFFVTQDGLNLSSAEVAGGAITAS